MPHTPTLPFSHWAGPRQPKLLIIGEAWGRSEAELRKPFVGESGKELWSILGEAFPLVEPELHAEISSLFKYGLAWAGRRAPWLEASGIAFTNLLNLQPYGNKISELCCKKAELPASYPWGPIETGLYLRPEYLSEIERLRLEIGEAKPNLVVCAGAKASWALLDSTKISSIRGAITSSTLVPGQKVLATYHPAAVLRQWSWRPIVVADFMKARIESTSPAIERPSRQIIYSPTFEEVEAWVEETCRASPRLIAADTETARGQITMISFARARDEAIVIPLIDKAKPGWNYWAEPQVELRIFELIQKLFDSGHRLLWQNGLYDIQYLLPLGFRLTIDEDTMLLHHSLLPEMNKGLGFLGSIYTSEPSWKLMRKEKADTEKRDE